MNRRQREHSAQKQRALKIVEREIECDPGKAASEILRVVMAEMPSLEVKPATFATWVSLVRKEMGLPMKGAGPRRRPLGWREPAQAETAGPSPAEPEEIEPAAPEDPEEEPITVSAPGVTFRAEQETDGGWLVDLRLQCSRDVVDQLAEHALVAAFPGRSSTTPQE